jgi:hypothetical protein
MASPMVPSLSEDGWVNTPSLMGDYLISHFFVSDYSQTQLYLNQVSSFPYLIQKYQNDLPGLLTAIQTTLNTYLGRYFSNVVVEASQYPNPTNSGSIGINLFVGFTGSDGVSYNLSKIIQIVNSKIESIINLNNNG